MLQGDRLGGRSSNRRCRAMLYYIINCGTGTEEKVKKLFNSCRKESEYRDTIWRRYKSHRSKAAFKRYKRARSDYIRTRWEEKER